MDENVIDDILKLQQKVIPEMLEILEKRYNILRQVNYHQPVGRRTLSDIMGIGERIIRNEVNILKEQELLEIKTVGMNITEDGKKIIEQLNEFIHKMRGLTGIEKRLQEKLGVKKVIIVPGDSDNEEYVLKDAGKTTANYMKHLIQDKSIIGITGGTTMAKVAQEMPSAKKDKGILVLPARGGIGKNVEIQANNIAAQLAQRLKGNYKLLHVPDNISKEALKTLMKIEEIKELITSIKNMDILIFGMGRADEMAKRRKLPADVISELMNNGAVAEAFGYYFDKKGNIVRTSKTVGISLDDFKNIHTVVGVACGGKKAEAIMAISSLNSNMILVTDEGAAMSILKNS
ncbi:sugar-binding transcriptional regulator [Clostridiisalibacter paucivorans]|uniref:sugar-binding transcriptional regulator n=1 Tax=Clostridiisalibacter paucivorans TaxID=408753 RepID=UPI0006881A7F|nr:sugar-binding domain-containing protein [Clostridiisalibacter paucivorans]